MELTKINATFAKGGLISLWEHGGCRRNTGSSLVVARPDGKMPVAVYIPYKGHLSKDNHALIPVHAGYFVISVTYTSKGIKIFIYKIINLVKGLDPYVEGEQVKTLSGRDWYNNVPEFLADAVQAAVTKAKERHCHRVCYAVCK